jgi:hypothetical protein
VIGWDRTEHGVAETPSLLQVSLLLCDWLGQDRAKFVNGLLKKFCSSIEILLVMSSTSIRSLKTKQLILLMIVLRPSSTYGSNPFMKIVNYSYCYFQEVKVQVISAEKCQSWFHAANRSVLTAVGMLRNYLHAKFSET